MVSLFGRGFNSLQLHTQTYTLGGNCPLRVFFILSPFRPLVPPVPHTNLHTRRELTPSSFLFLSPFRPLIPPAPHTNLHIATKKGTHLIVLLFLLLFGSLLLACFVEEFNHLVEVFFAIHVEAMTTTWNDSYR